MVVGFFYYRSNSFLEKEDALRRQGSKRLKEHFPKERTLQLEICMFTRAAIYFSNATSKWIAPPNNWVNGFKKINS
jgi:hypothetical protein